MTTLATSRLLVERLTLPAGGALRRALARIARTLSTDTARRPCADLSPHLRRDIGLGDIDVLDL